jgi:hypothetical protein
MIQNDMKYKLNDAAAPIRNEKKSRDTGDEGPASTPQPTYPITGHRI